MENQIEICYWAETKIETFEISEIDQNQENFEKTKPRPKPSLEPWFMRMKEKINFFENNK